jgi:iron complex outermembrane recepter protein
MFHKYNLVAGVAFIAMATSAAHAQAPASQAAASGQLGEIVVTAEKRPSTEQRTPIALNVATGKELAAAGVVSVNQIQNIAPSVNIAQNNANTLITIRGVSSRDYSETGDPAVAVSIDNFYLQRAFALNAAMFDVGRVEVLRGPQGTLYGRNATAGAINIATNKPSDKFELNGAAEVGNYGTLNLEGAVNVPVTDTLAVRVAGTRKTHQGYRNNGAVGDGDDNDTSGARVHVAWKPTDRLSVLLTGEYVHVGGIGAVQKGILNRDVNADGTLNYGSDKNFPLNRKGFTDITVKAARWAFGYDLGFATVNYYGGYQRSNLHRDNDQDGGTTYNYGFRQNEGVADQNHELRISSNASGPLHWQAGLYFFRETDNVLTWFQVHGLAVDPYNFYTFNYRVGSKSKAAFTQIGYDITDKLKVEGGVRYTKDNKSQVGYNIIAGPRTNLDNHYSGDKITWHAGVNWQATPRNLIYAKVDSGYKAGGYTTTSSFGPESITAYEIGSKNRFFNNKLQVNLDGFYYDYKDLQVQQNDPNSALVFTLNAGKARVYGVEFDTIVQATRNDRFDFNAAYLNAKYTRFCTVTSTVCPAASDLSGNRLVQAPKWSIGGGYQHEFRLPEATITARVQTHYQTKTYFTILNRAAEQQVAYTKTDVNLTYQPDQSHWSLSVYGRNLENSRILTADAAAGYAGGYLVQFADPRTYGGRVTFNF